MAEYAHPGTPVTTDWVEQHKGDAHVRLVEVDVDTQAYQQPSHPRARSQRSPAAPQGLRRWGPPFSPPRGLLPRLFVRASKGGWAIPACAQ
ncbi:MAG: hypothetical protein ACE5JJ_10345 [Nitrospinota bacterium]